MSNLENTDWTMNASDPLNFPVAEMPEKGQETDLWTRVKKNKKPIILLAIGIVTVAGVICGIRSRKPAVGLLVLREEITKGLPKSIIEATPTVQLTETVALEPVALKRPYNRPAEPFIRNMAEWKHHSAAKAAQAAEMGIDLETYQTLVVFSKDAA